MDLQWTEQRLIWRTRFIVRGEASRIRSLLYWADALGRTRYADRPAFLEHFAVMEMLRVDADRPRDSVAGAVWDSVRDAEWGSAMESAASASEALYDEAHAPARRADDPEDSAG